MYLNNRNGFTNFKIIALAVTQISKIVAKVTKIIVVIKIKSKRKELDFIDNFSKYHILRFMANSKIVKIIKGIVINSNIEMK